MKMIVSQICLRFLREWSNLSWPMRVEVILTSVGPLRVNPSV
jgi:hypothetical protein